MNILAALFGKRKPRRAGRNRWRVMGQTVTFGAAISPTGLYHCDCGQPDCQHVKAVDEAWQSGKESILINTNGNFWGVL